MLLLLAKDEIADEIAGIVGRYHAALFIAQASILSALQGTYVLCLFRHGVGLPEGRVAIDIKILRWLHKVVTTHPSITVDDLGLVDKVLYQIMALGVRILHDHPESSCVYHAEHSQA